MINPYSLYMCTYLRGLYIYVINISSTQSIQSYYLLYNNNAEGIAELRNHMSWLHMSVWHESIRD